MTVPTNVKIEVPETIQASTPEELNSVKVKALYSDGTEALKGVNGTWIRLTGIHRAYRITGKVYQEQYNFPIAVNRADPALSSGTVNIISSPLMMQIITIPFILEKRLDSRLSRC